MTRDYRSRAEPRSSVKKPATPAWVPFFYGFLLGAILVAAGWIVLTPPDTPLVWPQLGGGETTQPGQQDNDASATENGPTRPRFDFYTILPEMEVVISDEEAAPPTVESTTDEATTQVPTRYRLQVGSFRKLDDADRQKARLALLGVEAEIQKVNIGQGDIYYRVLTQPFDSRSELNEKRRMFQQNRINSLVVQMRN